MEVSAAVAAEENMYTPHDGRRKVARLLETLVLVSCF